MVDHQLEKAAFCYIHDAEAELTSLAFGWAASVVLPEGL